MRRPSSTGAGGCDAVYEALRATWQAGHLLIKQKKEIVHGNWELWPERNFEGRVRTAQRYMLLAKTVPEVLQLRGLTLRQAYLRLGIAVADPPQRSAQRYAVLPPHAAFANRFQHVGYEQTRQTAEALSQAALSE
jgi:hypothetical protein